MVSQNSSSDTAEREAWYEKINAYQLSPLWRFLSTLVTPVPRGACVPYLWKFAEVEPFVLEAGELITAQEAERRVLILENPGLAGTIQITTSLYAGLQLVKPGEIAPAHRHTQSALRFVLKGSGAHTAVDGERTVMRYGDFVITPPGAWHDHGNESEEPMIWLDGLDIPMLAFYDASFAEMYAEEAQPESRKSGHSLARYGASMLPVDHYRKGTVSPIFNYPYDRSREALEVMRRQDEWDPCHGLKMRYINPETGGFAMPTIATFLQLLPEGFKTTPYRSTDATIFVVVEGHGHSVIDRQKFEWSPQDIFVVPSWKNVIHCPAEDTVLFSYSDRAAQQKLGFFKEQRGGVPQNPFVA